MGRLIIVPQYPTAMRYQEWWFYTFPTQLVSGFSETIVLGKSAVGDIPQDADIFTGSFSPMDQAILFELQQIKEYLELEILPNDTLLLNDLSFPGLFAHVLFHKRPKKCYAFCHATSKNRFDYFQKMRSVKYPVEKTIAKLFDFVFVGSHYHKNKLNWDNCVVTYLPFPPFTNIHQEKKKKYKVVTIARKTKQKRNLYLEKRIGLHLHSKTHQTWEQYFSFLAQSQVVLITSKEETFGYQVMDAILNNCIPIAPNTCCYSEILPKEYLFSTPDEAREKITAALEGKLPIPHLLVEKECNTFYTTLLQIMNTYEKS